MSNPFNTPDVFTATGTLLPPSVNDPFPSWPSKLYPNEKTCPDSVEIGKLISKGEN